MPVLPQPKIKKFFQEVFANQVAALKAFIARMPSAAAKQMMENMCLTEAYEAEQAWSFPLYITTRHNFIEQMALQLSARADVNQTRKSDDIPLYVAAQNGYLQVVEQLLSSQADVNQAYDDGTTPLCIAAEKGYLDVVDRLLDAQADVNRAAKNGMTPLHMAAQKGHLAVVERLLAAQAYVNLATNIGITPLYNTVLRKHYACMELLLEAGAGLFGRMSAISSPPGLAGKVVIGLKVGNKLVTRKTPGFEQAITNLKELNQALSEKPLGNSKALIKACDSLLQQHHPEQQTLRIIKAKLYNLNNLVTRCLYELYSKPSYQALRQQIYERQISLPGELVSQLADLEDTPPKLML